MEDSTQSERCALSKTGYQVQPAMLVAWGARALYVGPSLRLAAHRNAVAVLAIALDGHLEVAHVPQQPELGFKTCQTVLIEPGQRHLIRSTGRECAFLYLDALSLDLQTIRRTCREGAGGASFQLGTQDTLIGVLRKMERSIEGWESSRRGLTDALDLTGALPDQRIATAIDWLMRAPGQATHVGALALAAGLSASRFQHLFKSATGVPYRRFRIWMRLRAALAAAQRGVSLTDAAHAAGFASSAHMSTAFKDMFGLAPSQLLAAKPVLISTADETLLS